jgi:hypothetical protein
MGLPAFQSEVASVPKRYCRIISGSVSAFHTVPAGALIKTDCLATKPVMTRTFSVSLGRGSGPA